MNSITSKVMILLALCGCGASTPKVPSGPTCVDGVRQGPGEGRCDSNYDRAEAVCLGSWYASRLAVELHGTPELADGSGLLCILELPGPEVCAAQGGTLGHGVDPYSGAPGHPLCVVTVLYADLPQQ
jgi:hypothetical protein